MYVYVGSSNPCRLKVSCRLKKATCKHVGTHSQGVGPGPRFLPVPSIGPPSDAFQSSASCIQDALASVTCLSVLHLVLVTLLTTVTHFLGAQFHSLVLVSSAA